MKPKSLTQFFTSLVLMLTLGVLLLTGCGVATQTTEPPTPILPLDVTVTKDLVYGKGANEMELKLDKYAPVEPGRWPLVIFLHRAGGKKEEWTRLAQTIAEQGAVVFAIGYTTTPPHIAIEGNARGYREVSDTVACAIRFARARGSDLESDTTHLTIVGFSYGGGVGAYMALVGDSLDRQWEEYIASRGGPPSRVDCKVNEGSIRADALVGIAGAYDAFVGYDGKWGRAWMQEKDPDLWEVLHSSIGENPDLKIRLLHSDTDHIIPYENSVTFEAPLAKAGYDVKLIQFGGGHTVPHELTVQTIMDLVTE